MKKTLLLVGIIFLGIWGILSLSSEKQEDKVVEEKPLPVMTTVVGFGDSLTYGTGAKPAMSYPAQLSRMLRMKVKNFGTPNATTAIALRKLPADVMRFMPAAVLITIGSNDMQNGVSKDAAMANLEEIIVRIQNAGGVALVGGVKMPSVGNDFYRGYQEVCEKTGAVLVDDILGGVMGKPDLMSDQIHPNGQGYKLVAEKFYVALKPYI